MIRIDRTRVAEPPILVGPGAVTAQDRWRRQEVRDALSEMQYGKCCYCEQKIDKSGHGQTIEHFRPKSNPGFADLKNTWINLLHACTHCNGAKGSKFPVLDDETPALIDPSDPTIDPQDHVDFDVDDSNDLTFARAKPREGSMRGNETIRTMKLNTTGQRYARRTAWTNLMRAYVEIVGADSVTKGAKVHAFRTLLGADHACAGFARAHARVHNLDARFQITIPSGTELG